MVRDGIVLKDMDTQVTFNQYSFCELVKHLMVELAGISYEEASKRVELSSLTALVTNVMEAAAFSHELPYYWAMFCLLWERLLAEGYSSTARGYGCP